MKILIISYFFPPFNRIGSLRMGKMAKYFHQFGHDIRVITNMHHSKDMSAPLEIPDEHCIRTDAITFEQTIDDDYYDKTLPGKILYRLKRAISYKKRSFMLPDSSWSWYSEGVEKADELVQSWKPDLIYSSALPISSHFIARKISTRHGIPWVAEYRDLWSGGHGARVTPVRSFFLKRIENWLLKPAIGLITVSQPLAAYLRLLHKKKISVIYNGFDTNPYAIESHQKENHEDELLTIVYTGSIYEGRDPAVLFEALKRMGDLRENVQVKFYTSKNTELKQKIKDYEIENCVKLKDFVPYNESLKVQSEADILLYLSYSSETHEGRGILSGKVFEYLGAVRPILSVGADSKHLLVEQGLMTHLDDAEELKNQLISWIEEKKKSGTVKMNGDLSLRNIYSRKEQTKRAEQFINLLIET